MISFLQGKKTYIIAALMVAAGLVRLVSGDIDLTAFLNSPDLMTVLTGFGFAAMRAGVAKQ